MPHAYWTQKAILKAGLHVRRKHNPNTSTSHVWTGTTPVQLAQAQENGMRSFFLCSRRPGSHVAYACACVVRVNQPLASAIFR